MRRGAVGKDEDMEAYSSFAEVYDIFRIMCPMRSGVPMLQDCSGSREWSDGLVLDLGCGTGSLTGLLAEAGYDMIGIDNSGEMLQMAMDKRAGFG